MAGAIVRFIGGFQAEVTVREQHRDELTITTHPVERGAAITDHAFKNPAQLTIEAAWSAKAAKAGSINDLYDNLLASQASVELLEVQTGKRLYQNMLIRSLATETDETKEYVLYITVQLQELLLVDTVQTTLPAASDREDASSESGVTDTGTKSTTSYSGDTPGV